MTEKTYTIANETGIHLKPAQHLVQTVLAHDGCAVTISKDGSRADGRSIISILGLELSYRSEFTVQVEGDGADQCLSAIDEVLRREQII